MLAICVGVAGLADVSGIPGANLREGSRGATIEVTEALDPRPYLTGLSNENPLSEIGAWGTFADFGAAGHLPLQMQVFGGLAQVLSGLPTAFRFAAHTWHPDVLPASLSSFPVLLGGQGPGRDTAHDLLRFRDLVGQGVTQALLALGYAVETGRIDTIPVTHGRAVSFFSQAVGMGDHATKRELDSVLLDEHGAPRYPSRVVENLEEFSEQDDAVATTVLAQVFVEDFGNQTTSPNAAKHAERDRNGAIGTALLSLGDLHMDGRIDSASGEVAFDYYADLLNSGAKVVSVIQPDKLISVKVRGTFPSDHGLAERAYLKAGSLGQAEAYLRLSDWYRRDSGVASDEGKALEFLQTAVDLGDQTAAIKLCLYAINRSKDTQEVVAAFSKLDALARQGNATAQYELGRILLTRPEPGRPSDHDRAVSLIQRASRGGHASATILLAQMQIFGTEIPRSPTTGLLALQKLADAGFADATLALGDVFNDGVNDFLSADPARAFRYYTQAAEAGSDSARTRMAGMLLRGEGVARDLPHGLEMLKQSAEAGNASALVELGMLYRDGGVDGVDRDPLRALGYFRRASELGDRRASLEAALIQLDGPDSVADPEAALASLTVLAAAGNAGAVYRLAEYYAGAGDPARAFRYYAQAAEAGSDSARTRMAGMLLRGDGVARDVPRGLEMLKQSAEAGSASALVDLGDAYARGQTGSVDIDGALSSYEAAATLGNTVALVRLADIYRYGLFSTTSESQAFEYLERAADRGNEYAEYMMGQALVNGDFGGAGMVGEGIDLLVRADRSGVADAATALALLDWGAPDGRFVANSKIDRLRELAAAGNISASLKLVEAYRDGQSGRRKGITSQNLVQARKELDLISDRIDPAEYEVQSLLIDLKTAWGPDFPGLFERIRRLPQGERPGAMRRILELNPNAFVYFVQLQLAEDGYYAGRADGLMTARTIAAIQELCDTLEADRLCRHGPLSPQVYTLLFYVF